jgi:hypothetical protein
VKIKSTFSLLLLTLLSQQALSQATVAGSGLTLSVGLLEQQYANAFYGHPALYNGPEYINYALLYFKRTGHQFFLFTEPQSGSVHYNDHLFTGPKLLYDVVRDQVVLKNATSPLSLSLVNQNVQYFFIGTHHFVRLVADSLTGGLPSTGFYEVLVDSPVQLLAKRSKRMQKSVDQKHVNVEFISTDKLFVRKAGVYHEVRKKSSVTRLFADHSKLIQQYIQNNRLKFRKKSREEDIVQVTRYYNGLLAQ